MSHSKLEFSDIANLIQRAQEAQELLESILSNYDMYTGQFSKISDYDCRFDISHNLINRIRRYRNFDDSE